MNDNNPNNPTIILVLFLSEITLFILLFSSTEHVAPDGAELPRLAQLVEHLTVDVKPLFHFF